MSATEARKKIEGITRGLNMSARRKGGEDTPPVAFIAAGNEERLRVQRIATGIPNVDEVLGGGWQRGGFNMVWGNSGAGKTRLCMQTIANQQTLAKAAGREFWAIYWHNEEGAFPYEAAIQAGVDFDTFLILDTQRSGEAVLNTLLKYLWDSDKKQPLNVIDFVVIDSVASVEPQAEADSIEEKGLEGSTVGRHAALFSKFFRHVAGSGKCGRHTAFLLVNQIRMKIDGYGDPNTPPGGQAMLFYPKIIAKMTHKMVTEGTGDKKRTVGQEIIFRITKNNTGVGHPGDETDYTVRFGSGIDMSPLLLDHAKKIGLITNPSQGWFQLIYEGPLPTNELAAKVKLEAKTQIPNTVRVQGEDNLKTWVRTDGIFRAWLETQVVASLTEQSVVNVADRPEVTLEEMAETPEREEGEA